MTVHTYPSWGGKRASLRVARCLSTKGHTCHLCGLPGADSADHDPPRQDLMQRGVPDPDALEYLWPAHLRSCNQYRGRRPITEALRAECRRRRLAQLGMADPAESLSPVLARRAPGFSPSALGSVSESDTLPPSGSGKNVTLVCGPPCSGKSTYVSERAQAGDLVVCHDELARAAGSAVTHMHKRVHRDAAEAEVARLLQEIEDGKHPRAWVIRTLADPAERAQLADRLGAEVIVLDPGRDELHRRAAARGRHADYTVRVIDWWHRVNAGGAP